MIILIYNYMNRFIYIYIYIYIYIFIKNGCNKTSSLKKYECNMNMREAWLNENNFKE